MVQSKKNKKTSKVYKTVSFDPESHEQLRDFCEKMGYNIGTYCQTASMYRMKKELESTPIDLSCLS